MKHLIVGLTVSVLAISLLIIACSKDKTANKAPAPQTAKPTVGQTPGGNETANKIPAPKTSISGEFVCESNGGDLIISEVEGNKMTFELSVVQVIGGNARTGQMEGTAELSGNKAIWKETDPERVVDGQPARLTFIFEGRQVKVTGENTDSYGGLGISFDGTYPYQKRDVEP